MRRFNKRNLTCGICRRGFNEHSCDHICPECFEIAGIDNEVNDHGPEAFTPATAVTLSKYLADIAKKGGDVERVKSSNDFIDWTLVPAAAAARTVHRVGSSAATNGVKAPVIVNGGEHYRSVREAFARCGLPMSKHQAFRKELKLKGELNFEHEGVVYKFNTVG